MVELGQVHEKCGEIAENVQNVAWKIKQKTLKTRKKYDGRAYYYESGELGMKNLSYFLQLLYFVLVFYFIFLPSLHNIL